MKGAGALPYGVTKEIRALLPAWIGCTAAVTIAAFLDDRRAFAAGVLAYVLGSIALGAMSIGHEYTNRTLTLLLSLPSDRRRLYLVKLGVLTPMLLVLAAIAVVFLFEPRALDVPRSTAIPMLSVMSGLFLAPWLTMLCHSPVAGVVFAVALPGLILAGGNAAGFAMYGYAAEARRLNEAVLWWGLTGLCAIAAVSSWRMFMHLEANDGGDIHVRLPRWGRNRIAAAAAPDLETARLDHPLWLLAKKELRLQQLTVAIGGLYLLGWVTVSILRQTVPGFPGELFAVATVFYSASVALLSGAMASAEERQFGTLESQVLLPMPSWKQFAVKAGMVVSVAVLLAVGLPALLGYVDESSRGIRLTGWYAVTLVALATLSLYVSSLCTSGLQALLVSAATVVVVPMLLGTFIGAAVEWALRSLLPARHFAVPQSLAVPLGLALVAGFLALVLRFALVNHRSSERSVGRTIRQVLCIVVCFFVGVVVVLLVA